MTVEKAKALVECLMPLQQQKQHFPCPRCGYDTMDPQNPVRNALSRYAHVYICDECGMDEAMRDYTGVEPLPLNEWAIPLGFDEVDE